MESKLQNERSPAEDLLASAPDEQPVPIREISRLTGVNTVTLRAWERRYGLLKPKRTGKGHRLYSAADIQKVKDIQSWLVRGLAIGKVRAVLEGTADSIVSMEQENIWQDFATQLNNALQALNRRKLEILLNDLIAVYPAGVIADRLLGPMLESLQATRYATATRREFFLRVLSETFLAGQYRQRQATRGKRTVLFKLTSEESDLLPQVLNYSLMINGFQSEYCGCVPTEEWVFAIEQLQPQFVILYSDSASRLAEVRQNLVNWEQVLRVPLLLGGKIVSALSIESEGSQQLLGVTLEDMLKNLVALYPPSASMEKSS